MDFRTPLSTITLDTPLVLCSGHFGYAENINRTIAFPWKFIGAIVLKSTTLLPTEGNLGNRICETACGLMNSVGLENPGIDRVVSHKLAGLPEKKIGWFASVAGGSVEDYHQVTKRFNETKVDAIEINISCPNVKGAGLLFGSDPVLASELVQACREATNKPLIAKLTSHTTDIAKVAENCIKSGADIISAINTVPAMAIDIQKRRPSLGGIRGGLSGQAIFPIALLNVYNIYQVAKEHGVPIIAQGGVAGGEEAIAMLLAGASAIGMGTALARDIRSPKKVLSAIASYGKKFGYEKVSDITGDLVGANR